ncbi:cytochrome ubiquinol oxidase subunit I [Methyloversatilis sp.]|uniref:cytochrome ubiquinol oxidase subunit I n=1 Tax=Methyloversatilis sp. TaxID=2569862 RepID=UPI002734C039|nr:cytochrome ubiquinol oxidase subunit I [Methyloversatilis sp.]MDP2868511.1 cytochrome ubiquinol oxidase subunit I [Methyloversatilis sp.]MDP3288626.1 cytochrome ubiquinol oxidase subunit I [Methyloversatilis sp.]MDP3455121.1 cytochrome ubiquinol oxidase subunit I [Methyloversatilis sp.]MDP3579630.1 cytochrome ubiquinol oxidase subunit I [Methyloversatilis sp.]
MDLDPVLLARIQFAANITFHILFPTITIALGWMLLFMRWRWLKTNQRPWLTAYRFWTKVFALTFALGVVSGITMSFQFGTNWPGFMEKVGNIAGPLLGFEVLTAFFLEATFLGVMLFGHGRVSERIHMLATFLVAFGTTMSAFWILVLNSWMQTPVGYEIIDGEFHVTSWLEIIFNPSFPWRFAHMLLASFLTMSFLVAGVSAWQVLRRKANPSSAVALRAALTLAALLIPVQIVVGDMHGLNTLQHQPQKIAAIEGVWETERGVPLLLFALPNEAERRNDLAIGIPKMASFILTHEWDGELKGLNEFENHPPVKPLFFGFRIMVAVGTLMLLVSWVGCWILRRHGWQPERAPRWLIASIAGMTFSGWVATVAGWYVTEIGRQPWIVQGLIKTADVASSTPAPYIALTLAGYLITYAALIVCYIGVLRYMAEKPSDTYDPAPSGGANVLGSTQLARKAGEA